jgi:hypothetical protein
MICTTSRNLLPEMLKTTRLFFRMLASPKVCLMSAGVAQSGAFTVLCHTWSCVFAPAPAASARLIIL